MQRLSCTCTRGRCTGEGFMLHRGEVYVVYFVLNLGVSRAKEAFR